MSRVSWWMTAFIVLLFQLFLPGYSHAADNSAPSLEDGITQLTGDLLSDRKPIGGRMVVVTDLTKLEGGTTPLGAFLSREIFTSLARRKVNLLERDRLEDAMRELKFNMTDLVNPAHAKRFGRFTGTDILLLGTVTDLRDLFTINVQLVEIETRKTVKAAGVTIRKDEAICGLAGVDCPGSLLISSSPRAQVYLDGSLAGETDWRGRFQVPYLDSRSHLLEVRREGYRTTSRTVVIQEGEETRVEAPLQALPSPGTAVALSLLLPGAGDYYLGHGDGWLYTLGVGGAVYGAIYYGKRQDEWILADDGQGGEKLEQRGSLPMYGFAVLAVFIWYKDLQHVYQSAVSERRALAFDSHGVQLTMTPEAPGVAVVWKTQW